MASPDFTPDRPFLNLDAMAAGLTRRQLQGRRFRSLSRGVRVPTDARLDLRARCEAAGLVLPQGAVFSHHTAAKLYGAPVAADTRVHASLVSPIEPRINGVVAHRVREVGEVWNNIGLRTTSPGRTFVDLAAHLDFPNLVAAGDGLLRVSRSRPSFHAALEAGARRPGIRLARRAFPLLDPRADSAPESHLRLLVIENGFTPDCVNEPLRDEHGRQWAKPDLAFLVGLALEYEGAHHRDKPGQWESDLARDNEYSSRGWYLIKVNAWLLYQRPEQLLAEIARVLAMLRRGAHLR